MAYTTYLFNNIYMFLNNIHMLLNFIERMHVMYPWTTYMWSLCNIFMHPPPSITLFVALSVDKSVVLMGILIYCCLKTFQLYYLDSFLPARWCFLPTVYKCLNGVALAQHSEATLTPRVIRMLECVYVCDEWDHYSLFRKKSALRAPSTRASAILVEFELTHTKASFVVAWFEACVCIAADFPQ